MSPSVTSSTVEFARCFHFSSSTSTCLGTSLLSLPRFCIEYSRSSNFLSYKVISACHSSSSLRLVASQSSSNCVLLLSVSFQLVCSISCAFHALLQCSNFFKHLFWPCFLLEAETLCLEKLTCITGNSRRWFASIDMFAFSDSSGSVRAFWSRLSPRFHFYLSPAPPTLPRMFNLRQSTVCRLE